MQEARKESPRKDLKHPRQCKYFLNTVGSWKYGTTANRLRSGAPCKISQHTLRLTIRKEREKAARNEKRVTRNEIQHDLKAAETTTPVRKSQRWRS